jgi:hypothetical protein
MSQQNIDHDLELSNMQRQITRWKNKYHKAKSDCDTLQTIIKTLARDAADIAEAPDAKTSARRGNQ